MYIIILAISQARFRGNVDTIHVNRFLNARKSYVILRHIFPNHRPSHYHFHTNFVAEFFQCNRHMSKCGEIVLHCAIFSQDEQFRMMLWSIDDE